MKRSQGLFFLLLLSMPWLSNAAAEPLLDPAAEPPKKVELLPYGKTWRQEALTAYWIGKKKGLGPYEIRAVQEKLIPFTIPVLVRNDEGSWDMEVIIQDDLQGDIITSTKLFFDEKKFGPPFPDWFPLNRRNMNSRFEQLLKIPLIPIRIKIFAYGFMRNLTKNFDIFVLTPAELEDIQSISINLHCAVILHRSGSINIVRLHECK